MEKILTLYPTKLRSTIKSEILSYLQCHEQNNCYVVDIALALNHCYKDVREIVEEMEKEGTIESILREI